MGYSRTANTRHKGYVAVGLGAGGSWEVSVAHTTWGAHGPKAQIISSVIDSSLRGAEAKLEDVEGEKKAG